MRVHARPPGSLHDYRPLLPFWEQRTYLPVESEKECCRPRSLEKKSEKKESVGSTRVFKHTHIHTWQKYTAADSLGEGSILAWFGACVKACGLSSVLVISLFTLLSQQKFFRGCAVKKQYTPHLKTFKF